MPDLASVILAAGHGTRMRSALPKVLHEVGGLSMLGHVMRGAAALGASRQVVVTGAQAPEVADAARALDASVRTAVQDPPRGTADAVTAAMPDLDGFEGTVIVLYADTPLVTEETLRAMTGAVEAGADLVVLGFEPETPRLYGRLVTKEDGSLDAIVEAKEATPEQLKVRLCNSGVMAMSSAALREHLPKITDDNAKGEFYLTDLAGLVTGAGGRAEVVRADPDEVLGVDDRTQLARAEALWQGRAREAMMLSGVTLRDPASTHLCHDTRLGRDVIVAPNVVFGPGVTVEDGAMIHAFSHLEGAHVAADASVGPYARLRPGAQLGQGAKVGNFVEIKKARLGAGAKVSHLTYLGDAEVGADANIGAGTITCNYDGYDKHVTRIGEGAFVGSNSSLVAPVAIGAGAYVGSGSVVTKDVAPDALTVARGKQVTKEGWAASFRSRKEQR